MVTKTSTAAFVVCAVVALGARAADEQQYETQRFASCFLFQDAADVVWVGHPHLSLGMVSVQAGGPLYRLSPALAEKLAPLVTKIDKVPAGPDNHWIQHLPQVAGEGKSVVLLRFQAKTRLFQTRASDDAKTGSLLDGISGVPVGEPQALKPGQEIYEIVSVRLVSTEFLTSPWRREWDSLDAGLKEIVAATRTAPGEAKKKRLAEAIEKSSRSLHAMVKTTVDAGHRDTVGKIDPKARAVRIYQRGIARQWGDQLRAYVARLRITPDTPLPSKPKECPALELFAASATPAGFARQIKQSWPDEAFEEGVMYSPSEERILYAWQVEGLTQTQFEALRGQAKDQLERRARNPRLDAQTARGDDPPWALRQWGVVLRPAGENLLAEKLLLRATLVEKVLDEDQEAGLQAGDLIIDYKRVYELVMGTHPGFSPMTALANKARYGGKLEVLRGDRIITIVVTKK